MSVKVAEYRQEAEAEAKKTGDDTMAAWPHIQKLGDSLRCTVECASGADMLDSWRRVQKEFDIRTIEKDGEVVHHGRLKNKLMNKKSPPDMLVNVILDAGGYQLVGEIQIHLRSIHYLKQEDHFPYGAWVRGCSCMVLYT